jgi:hypothetical protein
MHLTNCQKKKKERKEIKEQKHPRSLAAVGLRQSYENCHRTQRNYCRLAWTVVIKESQKSTLKRNDHFLHTLIRLLTQES